MPALSRDLKNTILVKREDLQSVFSFKLRGAYNKIATLSPAARKKGIVAASAGNHAQGVAVSASAHEIEATIVMPVTTPSIKVRSVRAQGGEYVDVVMNGDTFDQACGHAMNVAAANGATFIHPYDDPDVIAGQGTVGMEIIRQHPGRIDAIAVPVGGGGLLAGIVSYVKYIRPEIKIIAVEAEESACLKAAMDAGKRVSLKRTGIFADGVAVSKIGKEPFDVVRNLIDGVVTVTNDEICAAIKLQFDDTRSISEPAGALSLAGIIKHIKKRRASGKTFLTINSGANTNFDRLRYVSERYGLGMQTEALLEVTIPETPGSLIKLCELLGSHDITEFNYRYEHDRHAHIFVGVTTGSGDGDTPRLLKRIRAGGFGVTDLSGNELAKMHVVHMVGGKSALSSLERVFRFEFPERQGILREFLGMLRNRWNISLFHYRKHGGTYANVLIGLQGIEGTDHDLDQLLKAWPYPFAEETDNPAYKTFLTAH
jgi:threonine dehydratase